MVHTAVQRVAERLLASLPPDRAYTLTALSAAGLPAPVAHFIAQTLQRRLEAEAQALADARSRWFDYADADLQAAQERYFEVLAEHAQVPPEEWERTLRQAVEQVVPYLVQPARTLGAFVFPEGRDVLPAAVVLRRMHYFDAYPYLTEVIVAYVQRKGLQDVDRATFVPLLHRIEHRTPEEYDADGWVRLLDPLFETVGEGMPPRVPTDLLGRFFSDKGARALAERIEAHADALTRDELRDLLATRAVPAAPPEPEVSAPPVTSPPPMPGPYAAPPTSPAAPPAAPGTPTAVPLWQQYQRGVGRAAPVSTPMPAPAAMAAPAPPPTSPVQRARHRDATAQPLWQRFRSPDEADEPGTEPDTLDRLEAEVLGSAARSQRRVFVRQLFSGSEDAYRSLLERLRPARSWAEASHLIAEAFRQHQVNIYQDAAVAFTDAAETRFS